MIKMKYLISVLPMIFGSCIFADQAVGNCVTDTRDVDGELKIIVGDDKIFVQVFEENTSGKIVFEDTISGSKTLSLPVSQTYAARAVYSIPTKTGPSARIAVVDAEELGYSTWQDDGQTCYSAEMSATELDLRLQKSLLPDSLFKLSGN